MSHRESCSCVFRRRSEENQWDYVFFYHVYVFAEIMAQCRFCIFNVLFFLNTRTEKVYSSFLSLQFFPLLAVLAYLIMQTQLLLLLIPRRYEKLSFIRWNVSLLILWSWRAKKIVLWAFMWYRCMHLGNMIAISSHIA